MANKLDTRAIGLDAGLNFIHWLTGAENLHYGLWDGLDMTAGNLGAAQDAYTERLFSFLPKGKLRILDVGGGAGETARKLLALGHSVQIVVPSALLAERCRNNAPAAQVHQCKFEEFETEDRFDLCLFSESYQYIQLPVGLSKAVSLLDEKGEILIADCFRSADWKGVGKISVAGGGHPIGQFRAELARQPVTTVSEADITTSVAPSIDLEQGLFNVIGAALTRVDDELAGKRPGSRWLLHRFFRLFMNERKRSRLDQRLNHKTRTAQAFVVNNQYLIVRLARN
ncbi:MAG: methyltransferase domain-containing protein [Marinosulfonomonas sp.]|nr:methyltransferase domain-containing protein [Marinosulfonomonas sp.]